MNARDTKARAHALIGSAQACLELHQFRRAEEELVRAIAEVKACDRMEVESRDRAGSAEEYAHLKQRKQG